MEITVNFDSLDGTERTYQTCGIDWSIFTALTGYTEIYNETKTFPGIDDPVKCKTFYISSGDFGSAISGLPTTETDENTLNNYANTFTPSGRYSYTSDYSTNTTNFETLSVGTMPDDWGINPHYMRYVYTYSARDDKTVSAMIPTSLNEPWQMSEQYYLDLTGKMVQLICLHNNYKFAVSKGFVSPASSAPSYKASLCGGAYTYEPFNNNNPYNYYRTDYVVTHDVNGSTDISMSMPASGYQFPDRSLFHGVNLRPIADNTITFNIFISTVISGENYIGLASVVYDTTTQKYTDIGAFLLSENFWSAQFEPLPPNFGPESTTGGGQGTFTPTQQDDRGDAAGVELGIDIQVRNSSIAPFFEGQYGYKIHQLLPADMQDIFQQLYSTNYFQNWKQSFFNPLSAVLTLHMIPEIFQNPKKDSSDNDVKSQLTASGYNISTAISPTQPPTYPELNPIVHANIGSHNMEIYFDAFPDYAPFTKCYLHLPYIGVQEIDINSIAHGTISVDYVCDVLNGNIAAYVWCKDHDGHSTYKYCASGNCAYSIPLFVNAQDGSALGKLISSGVGFTAGLITGNAGAIVGGIAGAAEAAGAMLTRSTQVQGQFGSNAGMVMDTVCYLEIIRPDWIQPAQYQQLRGLTSLMSGTLADDGTEQHQPYNGYVSVLQIDTDAIPAATDGEKTEIETLLRAGVFIKKIQ